MDKRQQQRIKILQAIANGKKVKLMNKYTKVVHPDKVMTKKDFEMGAFEYKK